jgi:Carboxypeptidase regulatory-like domain
MPSTLAHRPKHVYGFYMPSPSRLPSLVVGALVTIGACIGPQAGHRDGYTDQGPPEVTGPRDRTTTHVRGFVIDAATNQPVAGARVSIDSTSAVSGPDGSYTLSNLLLLAGNIQTVKAGYDTSRTLIPLNGGEYAFNPRITPSIIAP